MAAAAAVVVDVTEMQPGHVIDDGRYVLGARVGRGTSAAVYEAQRREDGARHAVKWFGTDTVRHPEFFHDEVAALRRVTRDDDGRPTSPCRHIAALLDAQLDPRRHAYLVFELCTGGDLQRRLRCGAGERLRTRHVCELGAQLLRALALLRRQGVVHGDVKPANLLLRDVAGTHLVLADFGLSVRSRATLHQYGTQYCTMWYRAPEVQLQLHDSADARGQYQAWTPLDMWAFGCTFFEMLHAGRVLLPACGERDLVHLQWLVCGRPTLAYLDRCARRAHVLDTTHAGVPALRWHLCASVDDDDDDSDDSDDDTAGERARRRGIVPRDRHAYWQPAATRATVPLAYYPLHADVARLRTELQAGVDEVWHHDCEALHACQELLASVLTLEPRQRLTPAQALMSPLFTPAPLAAGAKHRRDE